METHERCFMCAFWNGDRCTQTYRLVIMATPTGGQIEFATTPGMVPEELKQKLNTYFKKLVDKIIPVIEMIPVWDEIREFQQTKEERKDCPGRRERDYIKPYLQVVRP